MASPVWTCTLGIWERATELSTLSINDRGDRLLLPMGLKPLTLFTSLLLYRLS